jgi:hypothetical protein
LTAYGGWVSGGGYEPRLRQEQKLRVIIAYEQGRRYFTILTKFVKLNIPDDPLSHNQSISDANVIQGATLT